MEALDHLLDQEGLEVDPINRMEKETPLHKAVQYANKEKEHGVHVVEMLIDAGADPRSIYPHPVATFLHELLLYLLCVRNSNSDVQLRTNRIRNKQKQRPIDIVDPRDTKLRGILQRAEYAMTAGNDVVADDDDDDNGPASDSD